MLTPDPVDEPRIRHQVAGFEREGNQQPAQPGARYLGEGAVVQPDLNGPKHPDLHFADFAMAIGNGRQWC